MKQNYIFLVVIVLILASCAGASTITQTYSYTFWNFASSGTANVPAPSDPVSGTVTVTFDPTSVTPTPTAVDAISLVIGSHTYNASEVSFQYPFGPNRLMIYGNLNGLTLHDKTNDFYFSFDVSTLAPISYMNYADATSATGLTWKAREGTINTVAPPIPEPASMFLLGTGLLAGIRRFRARRG